MLVSLPERAGNDFRPAADTLAETLQDVRILKHGEVLVDVSHDQRQSTDDELEEDGDTDEDDQRVKVLKCFALPSVYDGIK